MRATEWRPIAMFAMLIAAAGSAPASAQLRASENFALTQIIDRDTIMITGSRPSLRGRVMYGQQLPWGKSWTPGANFATVLRVDSDFSINGQQVPAGRYSVWLVPRANDDWSMFLHPQPRLFHTAHPDSTSSPYNFKLTAKTIDPVETLTWSINGIRGWRSTVSMAFGNKAVDFELRLAAGDINVKVAADVAAPLVGTYQVTPESRQSPFLIDRVILSHADGMLSFRFEGGNAEEWIDGTTWVLSPRGADTYAWVMVHGGEVVGMLPEIVFEVPEVGASAPAIELRANPGDRLFVRAVRAP
jgi:hypothetical protein